MTFQVARSDIVGAVQVALAAWVGPPTPLVVTYDNRVTMDIDAQTDGYLAVEILFLDGAQKSIGATKDIADYGQIHLVAHAKEGAGSLTSQKILDHFRTYFQLKSFSLVRTHAAKGNAPYKRGGWICTPLVVPFWYHSLVS